MLDKNYRHQDIEKRVYGEWEAKGAFKCGQANEATSNAENFSIVIPPPNVTGTLHMGHALNNTLQDILARFERMRGKDVLWQPGMDHAGIATQMVVERQLAERNEPGRREMGRDAFVERIWQWKEESGGTIINQLKCLGASCDWERERFTMDEGLSEAVRKVFVQLFEDKLIYKDKSLVNWDPKFQTAISDLEVENMEVDGHMWHFKYPLAGGETYEYIEKDEDGNITLKETRDYISIATTRPETMLGDGAVAVHPSDERYAPIIGKLCEIPVGPKEHRRLIPIITDEYPDPDFGSGAVKITGAHDFNDNAVARRNNIPMYRLMNEFAALREDGASYAETSARAVEIAQSGEEPDAKEVDKLNLVPDEYRGLDRFEARDKVIADIDAEGLMIQVEEKRIMQPFGDRSNVVIEPMLTDQWYVDAATLAKPAIAAIEEGKTEFVPKNWEKTYFEWMYNIEPWCISRQLWWGHRIPAWYGPDDTCFVALSEGEAHAQAEAHYGKRTELTQDEDVLDTWFSSGLWAFSTLGWPDETEELKKYYPTSVLVTGFDIIFFWIARMMMMSLHFMPDVPFKTIYVHALVRDETGAKMSKSKGNVVDPLDIINGIDLDNLVTKRTSNMMNPQDAKKIEKATRQQYPDGIQPYGADALRFTLAAMAAQGRDVKLSIPRIEGYRNFATKLWNASRFTQMNECVRDEKFSEQEIKLTLSKWICGETERTLVAVTSGIENYKFNEASHAIYDFTWHIFCDWYLELIKPVLNGGDEEAISEIRAVTAWVLDQILKMLHPFMPFITEELWQKLPEYGQPRDNMLILTAWPQFEGLQNEEADKEIDWVIRLVTEIRSTRSEMNVPVGAKIPLVLCNADGKTLRRAETHEETLKWLARLETIMEDETAPKGSLQIILDEAVLALPLEGIIDVKAECDRLRGQIKKAESEVNLFEKKLSNEKFVSKAPPHVVEEQKNKKTDAQELLVQLEQALKRFEEMAG